MFFKASKKISKDFCCPRKKSGNDSIEFGRFKFFSVQKNRPGMNREKKSLIEVKKD